MSTSISSFVFNTAEHHVKIRTVVHLSLWNTANSRAKPRTCCGMNSCLSLPGTYTAQSAISAGQSGRPTVAAAVSRLQSRNNESVRQRSATEPVKLLKMTQSFKFDVWDIKASPNTNNGNDAKSMEAEITVWTTWVKLSRPIYEEASNLGPCTNYITLEGWGWGCVISVILGWR